MTILHNAIIVDEGKSFTGYVVVSDGFITEVEPGTPDLTRPDLDGARVMDLDRAHLLPGAIDTHVHFREPGMTDKGDIASESLAAIKGGVTSYIEMPNTRPATTTIEAWESKMERARATSLANHAFFLGATDTNLDTLRNADYTRIPGVKLFMGSSTGGMLVDGEEMQRRIFAEVPSLIAVHAEDESIIRANRARIGHRYSGQEVPLYLHPAIRSEEACDTATYRAVRLATETGARLHVTHVSTDAELRFFMPGDNPSRKQITAETCPQYLIFSSDDYATRGTRIKCNPAIKTPHDRDSLRRALEDGLIDSIATDHAPHLLSQKQGDALTATSGMPGVQFSVPLMLEMIGPVMTASKMAHNPAAIFRIDRRGHIRPGYHADLTVARLSDSPVTISDDMVVSRCGWTPYTGLSTRWTITDTMVSGHWAMRHGEPLSAPGHAEPLKFNS